MYWESDGVRTSSIHFPLYKVGVDQTLTLTLVTEAGENFTKAYLCTPITDYLGIVSAKKSTYTRYREIMGIYDAECYLGTLLESTSTDIDFTFNFPEDWDLKEYVLPILLIHDGAESEPFYLFCGNLDYRGGVWEEEYYYNPIWRGVPGGCKNYQEGSLCIAEGIEENQIPDDERVVFALGDLVYINPDYYRTLALADKDLTLKEATVIGIITAME